MNGCSKQARGFNVLIAPLSAWQDSALGDDEKLGRNKIKLARKF